MTKTYNIGFINSKGENDETQLDTQCYNELEGGVNLINLILSLREEMDICEITYIELVEEDENIYNNEI